MGNYWKNCATFNFNIWSHCSGVPNNKNAYARKPAWQKYPVLVTIFWQKCYISLI